MTTCCSDNDGNLTIVRGTTYPFRAYLSMTEPRETADAAMTAASPTLTSAKAKFLPGDVGRAVTVQGAGANRGYLIAKISAYTSATAVTLASNASFSVADAKLMIYTPIDLTGATAVMRIKTNANDADSAALQTYTLTTGGVLGTLTRTFTAAETTAMTWSEVVYQINVTFADASVTRYVAKRLMVTG